MTAAPEKPQKVRRPRPSPQDVFATLLDEPDDMQLPPALGTDGTNSPVDDCDWWLNAPVPTNKKTAATVDVPRRISEEARAGATRVTSATPTSKRSLRANLHEGGQHAADLWGALLADVFPDASDAAPLLAQAREFVPCPASQLKADPPAFTLKQAQEASEKKRSKNKLSVRFQRRLEEEPIVAVWKGRRILRAADLSRAGETLAIMV